MKALIITNLYPYSTDLDNDINTKALHNIVKLWGEDTEVIRPLYLPTDLKIGKKMKVFPNKKILINNVKVNVLPIWKIPKTRVYFHDMLIKYVMKKNIKADIIISHGLHCAVGSSKLARLKKIPFILGIHNNDILEIVNSKLKNYYSPLFKQAVFIACRSQSILNEVKKIYPEYSDKCFVAFSGIEKNIIHSKVANIAKMNEWKGKQRPLRFITAASLKKLKNIDVNLIALSNLDDNIKWEYTILGNGAEETNLKKLTIELGIEDKVKFVGHQSRENVLSYMKNSDIFIMVSAPETFGLAYLEAMASGCLVIGAYKFGIDGIVKDGINGFLCNPKDNVGIKQKIEFICEMDINSITDIITQANNTIVNYTEDNASKVYMKMIKKALKGSF